MEKRELVIIGAGPAGLTAAIYGRRSGLDVLVLEKGVPGGQINLTDEIENWTGVIHASGPELAESFRKHAEHFGPEFREAEVQKIEIKDGSKLVVTDNGTIEAEAIIVATGAKFKKLGVPGEEEFTGRGVSYCAVCDGAFFEEQEVAVIGGGNTAVEEALYLTQFASKVYIIHRRDSFRADKVAVERAMTNDKIEVIWNTVVKEIAGDDMVTHLVLHNVKTQEDSKLPVAGVFVFVGMEPNSKFLGDMVDAAPGGWIKTNEKMETSVEGIFAAGDVRDKYLRQVITAAGDGATAAMAAYAYIAEQLHLRQKVFEPEHAFIFLYSSIDEAQMSLVSQLEELTSHVKDLALIDGYKNARMVEKLGVKSMPVLLELSKGNILRSEKIESLEDARKFIGIN
ncbi:thioredoxin reductase [Thermovirga lienii DSM 17291]|uniref:Thioredoxin reductase n=1 Tax=Thermovirga lienii (strain ATCC BAA-1197 / DSM 17291 / Cas60314) TaxID=580340 RepID=G7V9B2_THELD|nr:thioredoxin-disulfide reductase [Thermovirga lienii]AER66481.1 thioredoxin reductase [Thermovirga lienii DSM 17291]MDN5318646.1 thioredoxin reductase [Thermovirga sp.]MDN5367469.1 thioredoxin reductase [Thermovirga sp.]HCD72337.1 thioredoxin-disulfide reductase [Thermovirga lienii]